MKIKNFFIISCFIFFDIPKASKNNTINVVFYYVSIVNDYTCKIRVDNESQREFYKSLRTFIYQITIQITTTTARSSISIRPTVLFCSFSFYSKLFKNFKRNSPPPYVVLGSCRRRRIDCGKRKRPGKMFAPRRDPKKNFHKYRRNTCATYRSD